MADVRQSAWARGLLLAFLFAGCTDGSGLLLPGDSEPAIIKVKHGNGQSGRVGEPVADSLVFEVTDGRGRPVPGARIVLGITSAGPGADVVPDTAETDANGLADARLVLGTTIGPQVGEARVLVRDGVQEPSTTFTGMAVPEDANGMAAVDGEDQTGAAGSTLGQPLVVQVTDNFGNPISGQRITWTAEGGGEVSATSNVTDGDGRASVVRTLGPTAGLQSTVAASEGLAGSPVTFIHTVIAGNASSLTIISGNNQTGRAGARLPADLVVRLIDGAGNGVPGQAVTFVVSAGGGSVSPQNALTDEAGYATAQWTLGPTPGGNRLDAVASGIGVVNFLATGTVGVSPSLAIVVQPPGTAQTGEPLSRQPVVQLRDGLGANQAAAGVAVTAQLSGGSGELLGTRQRLTDAAGRATFTDLAIGGAEGTRILVFTASGYAGAASSAIDVRPAPTTTIITSHSPNPSLTGATVIVGFRVTAAGVVPGGSVTVTDGVQSCSGTLSGGAGNCALTLTTVGQRTLRATYSGAPGLSGSSDTEVHTVNASTPPPPGNEPPDADFNWHCEGLTCRFTDASEDNDGDVVGWSWNFGDGQTTTEREPVHTFPGGGEFLVSLIVRDDDGAVDQSTAHVDVEGPRPPENKAPHAEFDVDCVNLTCNFTDESRDDDGNIVSRSWNYGDGTPASGTPAHTYAAPGKYTVTLTVQDDDGAFDSRSRDADAKAPPPENQAPVPEFTSSCNGLTCSFQDQSTDDRGIASRSWNFGDPNSGGNNTSGAENPNHTFSSGGQFTVRLTVTDSDGESRFVEHQVGVTAPPPPNQAPTAAFTFGCTNLSCSFSSSGSSDPDGTIASRIWDFDDGTGSSGENVSHTFGAGGTYNVRLTVRDDDGAEDSETHQVTVSAPPPPNQPPTAAFSANCNDLDCSFNSGASDDPDGNIVSWSWNFGDGSAGSGVQNPTHAYTTGGTYNVTLTVTDDDNATDDHTVQVTVTAPPPPNQPPTAAFTAPSCTTNQPCQFNDASTDSDGSVVGWDWDFDDNGAGSLEQNPSHTYGSSGTYNVKLRVKDNDQAQSGEVQHAVTVTDPPPPPNTAPTAQIGMISCVEMHCEYTDASTDPQGAQTIANWNWTFGDGETSGAQNPSHDYSAPGDYPVTLTVTDNQGLASAQPAQGTASVPGSSSLVANRTES